VHFASESSIKLQNAGDASRFLRISETTKELDGVGSGGPWTEFEVIQPKPSEPWLICLGSKAHRDEGLHVSIWPNGTAKHPQPNKKGCHAKFYVLQI